MICKGKCYLILGCDNKLHVSFDRRRRFDSTGGSNKINDGWIPFSCFTLRVLIFLTGTLDYNRAIINGVIHVLFLEEVEMSTVEKGLLVFDLNTTLKGHFSIFKPGPYLFIYLF